MVGPVLHWFVFFNNHLMSCLHQHTRRAHSLQLTSCPERGAAARWWWDEQKETKKKEESPSRHRRREETGERRRVLWGRGHVYDRHELRWGRGEWWQQVGVRKCLCAHCRFHRNTDLVMMNWSCREQGGLFVCLRTAANQNLSRWCFQIRFSQLQRKKCHQIVLHWLKADMFVGHTPGICPLPTVFVRPTIMFVLQRPRLFLESSPHAWLGEIPGTFRPMR